MFLASFRPLNREHWFVFVHTGLLVPEGLTEDSGTVHGVLRMDTPTQTVEIHTIWQVHTDCCTMYRASYGETAMTQTSFYTKTRGKHSRRMQLPSQWQS